MIKKNKQNNSWFFPDSGTYTCNAENGSGYPKSASIRLSVLCEWQWLFWLWFWWHDDRDTLLVKQVTMMTGTHYLWHKWQRWQGHIIGEKSDNDNRDTLFVTQVTMMTGTLYWWNKWKWWQGHIICETSDKSPTSQMALGWPAFLRRWWLSELIERS